MHMKQLILILTGLLLFLAPEIAGAQTSTSGKEKHPFLTGRDCDPQGGADTYASRGDNPQSAYYVNPDFFTLASNDTLTILPRFRTMQQTTEWSCGCVAALLVLRHFGCEDETEESLACALHSMTDRSRPDAQPGTACRYADYGTSLAALHDYFAARSGFRIVATSYRTDYTPADLVKDSDLYPACDTGNLYPTFPSPDAFAAWLTDQLRLGRPVLAEWSDWDGHWVVIIGIDNNGTPDFCGDDTLLFADPYDTSDHRQDGYSIAPLERFFYSWKDRAIAPKPYQLQPFVVVDKKEKINLKNK